MKTITQQYLAVHVPGTGQNDDWLVNPLGSHGPALYEPTPRGRYMAQKEITELEKIGVNDARIVTVRVRIEVINP